MVLESGCECQHVQWTLLSVPTPQQTKQKAPQAGDSPLAHPAIPFPFTPLRALQSGVSHGYRATAPSPPGSMAFSMPQELGWIPLSCLCAPGDVSQGGEAGAAGGNAAEQQGQRWLFTPGTLAEAWAPLLPSFLLNLPVYLSPMEIFPGFACVGFGLLLPPDHAEPRLGRLLLQQVKLWQLPRQLRRVCWALAPASLSALLENSACPQARRETLIYSDLGKSQLLIAFTDNFSCQHRELPPACCSPFILGLLLVKPAPVGSRWRGGRREGCEGTGNNAGEGERAGDLLVMPHWHLGTSCCPRERGWRGWGEDHQVWFYSLPQGLEQSAQSVAGPDGACLLCEGKCKEK